MSHAMAIEPSTSEATSIVSGTGASLCATKESECEGSAGLASVLRCLDILGSVHVTVFSACLDAF